MRRTCRRLTAALALVPALALAGCSDAGRDPTPVPSGTDPTATTTGPSTHPTPAAPPAGVGIVPALRPWLVRPEGSRLPEPRAGVVVQETASRPGRTARRHRVARPVAPQGRPGALDPCGGGLRRAPRRPGPPRPLRLAHLRPVAEDTADIERGGPGLVLAEMGSDGAMAAQARGAQVLDQALVPDGGMGPMRESGTSTAAVAIVRWQSHRWFVLAERTPSRTRHDGRGGAERLRRRHRRPADHPVGARRGTLTLRRVPRRRGPGLNRARRPRRRGRRTPAPTRASRPRPRRRR